MPPQQTVTLDRQMLMQRAEFADAHCHLNLFNNPAWSVNEAIKRGVRIIVTAGGNNKDNADVAQIAMLDRVFGVLGIGPDFSVADSKFVEGLENTIKSNSKLVGIGEIGIDHKVEDTNSIEVQREVFSKQLELANKLNLPVVIHSRGALDEIRETLESMKVSRVLFHFFEGDEKQAAELAKKGYFISIPPAMTEKRKRVIKEVNINNIVAETDSPIVGKTPADVIGVCETIAQIKGVSLEEVATKTTENIRRLFYI